MNIELKEKLQRLQEGFRDMVEVCNKASTRDNLGFSGADLIGHSLAVIPIESWNKKCREKALNMANKYRGQLGFQIEFTTEERAWMLEIRKEALIQDGFLIVKFEYDPEVVSLIKNSGFNFRWNSGLKCWYSSTVNEAVLKFLSDNGFSIPEEFDTEIEEIIENPPVKQITEKMFIENKKLVIQFEYNPLIVSAVKELGDRKFNSETKNWTVDLNGLKGSVDAVKLSDIIEKYNFEVTEEVKELLSTEKKSFVKIDHSKYPFMKDYQVDGVNHILEKKRAYLGDQMGLGKTLMSLISIIEANVYPALVIVPNSLKYNWYEEAKRWTPDLKVQVINSKDNIIPGQDLYIINYDIIKKYRDHLIKLSPKFIIWEEAHFCFPYETLIQTDKGQIPIGEIVEKELKVNVLSFNSYNNALEYKDINFFYKNQRRNNLLEINHSSSKLTCTDNHKIFVKGKGYVEAKEITSGEELFILPEIISNSNEGKNYGKILLKELCSSFKGNNANNRINMSYLFSNVWQEGKQYQDLLFKSMCRKIQNVFTWEKGTITVSGKESPSSKYRKETTRIFIKNENKQSHVQFKFIRKNEKESTGKNLFSKGWEWFINKTTINFNQGFKFATGEYGIPYLNKSSLWAFSKSTNELQSGYSNTANQISYRSRREYTQTEKMEILRSTKNRDIKFSRVESIKVLESRNRRESNGSFNQDQYVYCLEINDNNNFFANGILVSNCKNKTQRTDTAKELMLTVNPEYSVMLSGTILTNRPKELVPQLEILGTMNQICRKSFDFLIRYCGGYRTQFGWDFSGSTNSKELHEKLTNSFYLRREKEQVLKELPAKTFTKVSMDIDNRKDYNRAEADLIAYFRDLIAQGKADPNAIKNMGNAIHLVEIEKLKQIALNGKLAGIIEWVSDFIEQEKLVLFVHHKEAIKQLKEAFPDALTIVGGDKVEDRQRSVNEFQNNPNKKLIICSIKAAGVGLTLTASSNVAFVQLTWTPADLDQCSDRVHRIGQEDAVNIYILLAHNTIEDKKIYPLIEQKRKVFDAVARGVETDEIDTSLVKDLINSLIA